MSGKLYNILLVDDDASVRSFTRLVLERSGYQILDACDAKEALRIWKTIGQEIDLLLTDITLEDGQDGRALARQLKSERPSLRVILFSGYSSEIEDETEKLGIFLQKPFSLDKLVATVRSSLSDLSEEPAIS